ncbi:MAG: response regulator [Candidatus Acidiferrales bacterium]
MEFKPRILVVDDNQGLLRLLGELLEEMGAEPCLLTNSVHAAELANRDKFDGAIVDWKMPEMDGLELTRSIRGSRSNKRIPVVMLTGELTAGALQESFKAGVNFFLQKPVSVTQLRHLLNATRGAMLEERRSYQRAPINLRVRLHAGHRQLYGQCVNLSGSGMLLSLEESLEEDTEVSVEFTLPHSIEPLHFTGRLMRRLDSAAPGELSGHGVGIEFTNPYARHRRLVINFVEKTLESLAAESA